MIKTLMLCALGVGIGSGLPAQVLAQEANSDSCAVLSQMRSDYRAVNTAISDQRTKKIIEEKPVFDAEETGCVGSWGVNLGLGISGLASSFFDQLKDQACSAMNDYVNGQLDALTSSVSAPLDLVGLDFSLGGDKPFNMEVSESELGLDTGSIVDDVFDQAPNVTEDIGIEGINDQIGNNPLGGRSASDLYIDQGRGESIPAPDWGPK